MEPFNRSTIRYIVYVRKSSESEERQALSIESQINELQKLIQRDKLKIVDIKQEAHSAKAPGRPVFNEVTQAIQSGEADGLIVWSLDRVSRNSVDAGLIVYLFDLNLLKEIVTPSQIFRNNPTDKYMVTTMCGNAKWENDNKSLNVKRGMRTKCEKGMYPCPAPIGYINDKYAERGSKKLLKDPERFDLVKKMFKLVLSQQYTPIEVYKIARDEWKLTRSNGKPIARSSFYYMLTNPVYSPVFEYPLQSGNWYKGIHESMITEEEFDMIQAILGNKGKPRPKSHIFAFTGLMRCGECNAMITCEEKNKMLKKEGILKRYVYYHCTKRINPNCTQGSIEEKELQKQIDTILEGIEIPDEFHEWALKWLKKQNKVEVEDRRVIQESRQKEYQKCLAKLDNLIDMRAGNEITEDEYKKKRSQLMKEKTQYEESIHSTEKKTDEWYQKADDIFTFVRDARKRFNSGDLATKREVLASLGSNSILLNKILRPNLKDEFLPMKNLSSEVKEIHARFEPENNIDRKLQLDSLYASSPVVLPS